MFNQIKRMSKKRLFAYLYIPFVSLILIDLITTYEGVCNRGHFELNPIAIPLSQIGFLGISLFQFGQFALLIGTFTILIKTMFKNHEIYQLLILVVWVSQLLTYVETDMSNINMLYADVTGEFFVEPTELLPEFDNLNEYEQYLVQQAVVFEPVRNDFCRILP